MTLYPEEIEHEGEIIDVEPPISEREKWLVLIAVPIVIKLFKVLFVD